MTPVIYILILPTVNCRQYRAARADRVYEYINLMAECSHTEVATLIFE